jgi:dihydrofolate reductase
MMWVLVEQGENIMRKLILLMHVSLDGFVAGPNGEMDWIVYNDELESDAHSLHETADTAIFGRVTYQMMKGYWPTVHDNPTSTLPEKEHATWLDNATKIVVSKTLENSDWQNTRLVSENISDEITKLKQQPGKAIWLVGSITLAQTLMRFNLIDEYRINVNPVVLGSGKTLFCGDKLNLTLTQAKPMKGGVVALRYQPSDILH